MARLLLLSIFILHSSFAVSQSVDGDEIQEILLNSIYEELFEVTKDLKPPKKLVQQKKSINQGSRGKLLIEQMKRKNREKIAKMRGLDPSEAKSGKDLVGQQKAQNKQLISDINEKIKSLDEWQNLARSEIAALRKQLISDWRKKHALKIKHWEREKEKFNEKKEKYKKTAFDLPVVLPKNKIEKTKERVEIKKEHTLIPKVLDIPIRDQQYRPTCAAFAGLRAVEAKLFKQGKYWNLSEQYFYWASKEDCRHKKCMRKGSWVGHGLEYSKSTARKDIPFEHDCKYVPISKKGNETQIPLNKSCQQGKVKVESIKYFHSTSEVISQLKAKNVVIASMRLTPNFYSSKAIILDQNKFMGKQMDSHASGHSMAIVGFVKLPQVLNEGRVCFVVANSWGQGWGQGGYSCISEKWMINQKQINPFVAVTDVSFKVN